MSFLILQAKSENTCLCTASTGRCALYYKPKGRIYVYLCRHEIYITDQKLKMSSDDKLNAHIGEDFSAALLSTIHGFF